MRPPKKPPGKAGPKSYVAYYRISKEGGTGLGIDAQRESVARLIGPSKPIANFTEEESGKKHTNRPQLLAAMAEAKKQGATLVIAKLDRLARNVHFITGLLEADVDFVCCDNPGANKMMVQMLAVFAEHEREMISQRTKAALAQVKARIEEKGFHVSKHSGQRITKLGNPNWEVPLIKARAAKRQLNDPTTPIDSMRKYRSDGASLREIAVRLNTSGVKTRSGHAWYASTVREALKAA